MRSSDARTIPRREALVHRRAQVLPQPLMTLRLRRAAPHELRDTRVEHRVARRRHTRDDDPPGLDLLTRTGDPDQASADQIEQQRTTERQVDPSSIGQRPAGRTIGEQER